MRSGTGTKSGEPGVVTFVTNSTMDFFAAPSFHEGNGSWARRLMVVKAITPTSVAARIVFWNMVFMVVVSFDFAGEVAGHQASPRVSQSNH
jgi:hypothetical protein